MRKLVFILALVICSSTSRGQNFSWAIDSLTLKHISLLPESQRNLFDSVLEHRKQAGWGPRIDTMTCDYAFIEESFCYHTGASKIIERYFLQNDQIPKYAYLNGNLEELKYVYNDNGSRYPKYGTYYLELSPLRRQYKRLKPTQELVYNKTQIWTHGCVISRDSETRFVKKRTLELQTTYQVQTMIDRVNKKVLVSVQLAPAKPKFKTFSYNPVWDF